MLLDQNQPRAVPFARERRSAPLAMRLNTSDIGCDAGIQDAERLLVMM
jgi:hypothetical protein